jgi:hypothetical protein
MPWENHWTPEARRKRDATRRQTELLKASKRGRAMKIPDDVPDQEDDDWREFFARRARLGIVPSAAESGYVDIRMTGDALISDTITTTSKLPIAQFYTNPSQYAATKTQLSKYAT